MAAKRIGLNTGSGAIRLVPCAGPRPVSGTGDRRRIWGAIAGVETSLGGHEPIAGVETSLGGHEPLGHQPATRTWPERSATAAN